MVSQIEQEKESPPITEEVPTSECPNNQDHRSIGEHVAILESQNGNQAQVNISSVSPAKDNDYSPNHYQRTPELLAPIIDLATESNPLISIREDNDKVPDFVNSVDLTRPLTIRGLTPDLSENEVDEESFGKGINAEDQIDEELEADFEKGREKARLLEEGVSSHLLPRGNL